jgi:hypothetical protein
MAKKPTKRALRVKLWLDIEKDLYWNPLVTLGTARINVPVLASAISRSKSGYPWSCWLADAIMEFASETPKAFPHPVLYAYVIESVVFIITEIAGQPSKSKKYTHNFGKIVDAFDVMTKAEFSEFVNGDALMLKLSPGRVRVGESTVGGNTSTGKHTYTISRGARRRAENANLIPRRNRPAAELYT